MKAKFSLSIKIGHILLVHTTLKNLTNLNGDIINFCLFEGNLRLVYFIKLELKHEMQTSLFLNKGRIIKSVVR